MTRFSIAEAQRQLSTLVLKVSQEGETAGAEEQTGHLANVQGWLEDDDPFFSAIDEIVEARHQHTIR